MPLIWFLIRNKVEGVKLCLSRDRNFKTHAVHACIAIIGLNYGKLLVINSFKQSNAPGSAKANGREPKTGLGRVFNFKLGCTSARTYLCRCTPTSIAENSAQVKPC
jgi:hypothetical protein